MAAADRRIEGGHRYFFLMCLAIYAYKCGVPKKQLRQDMKKAFMELQKVKHENVLTADDIRSALEAYDKEYYNFTISDIEALTNVRIDRNKRNGRKQELHLRLARGQLAILKDAGERSQGRPAAQEQVHSWRQQHRMGRRVSVKRNGAILSDNS